MRCRFVILGLVLLGSVSYAEVIRCSDPAGNVSYTDGACPSGARVVGRVAVPEAAPPATDGAEPARPSPSQREPAEIAAHPPPVPSGPIAIDARGSRGADPAVDSRWSDSGVDPLPVDDGYGYGYPGGAYRRPPPRDMRPRIRHCDAGGCEDRQGNRYNRSGQLERYQSLDGKTCRPVGTTTVCR